MEWLRDRRIDCASGRRGRWPWIMVIAAVILAAIAPVRIAAQEEEMPTPMATPEMMMLPKVAIFAQPGYGTAPLTVGFIPQIHDIGNSDIVSYRWVFGNGQVATTPPLVTYAIYKTPGVYVASLTITTADGRSATGFAGITVKAPAD
jgi:PKD repeat protein